MRADCFFRLATSRTECYIFHLFFCSIDFGRKSPFAADRHIVFFYISCFVCHLRQTLDHHIPFIIVFYYSTTSVKALILFAQLPSRIGQGKGRKRR